MKAKPSKHPGDVVLELNRRDEPLLEAANAGSFRLQNILVPVDFSDCSRKAVRYALPFAKLHGAAITLLYVVPTSYAVGEYGGVSYVPLEDDLRASAERELAALVVDEIQAAVRTHRVVGSGSAAAEIMRTAKELPADLIVIATHGRTGLRHVLLGSVAEHVVRSAPCPVLVVREKEREFVAD